MRTILLGLSLSALAAAILPSGRTAAQAQGQQAPVFRTNIDVARVTVRVLDRDRRPVRGLTEADFEVLIDGRPQRIVAVDAQEADPPTETSAPWVRDVSPDIATNDLVEPRLIVIILDDAMAGAAAPARMGAYSPRTAVTTGSAFALKQMREVANAVLAQLGPRDLASVVFTADNNAPQDFTRDRERLRAAIDRFHPTMIPEDLAVRYSTGTVRRAIELLRELPDVPSAIFWVGAGDASADPELLAPRMAPLPSADSDIAQRQGALDVRAVVSKIAGTAHLSNVPVYPVSTIGMLGPIDPATGRLGGVSSAMMDDERTIAGATGGRVIAQTNAPALEIPGVFEELAVQYTIGYQIEGWQNDGRFRRVQVRVKRPDVIIEPPTRGFFAPTQQEIDRATRNAVATAPTSRAIAGLIPLADEPLRLAVAPIVAPPSTKRGEPASAITLTLGIGATPTTYIRETVQVEVRVFDGEGRRQVARRLHTASIPASSNVPRDILSSIRLKPGRYNIRVSVHRAQERKTGSVYTDVTVPDFERTPLSVSGLFVLAKPANPVTREEGFDAALPALPTTTREFAADAAASIFFRVYAGGRRPVAPITVRAVIRDEADEELFARRDELTSSAKGADYQFALPLKELRAGQYVARFTIEAPGAKAQRHDLRFRVIR